MIQIITPRLRLESAREAHAALIFEQLIDERLWKHFPELRPKSLDEVQSLYRRWEQARDHTLDGERIVNWTAFERATDEPVASNQTTVFPDGTAAYALVVYAAHHRKGYAKEFSEAVFTDLRAAHAVRVVRFEIDTHNKAAVQLAKSLGFALAEERRGVDRLYGLFGDESVYVRHLDKDGI
ncbi:MAG: hypothetical protein NVS1B14_08850 [Vulcanimicrobiaceae bacterium]